MRYSRSLGWTIWTNARRRHHHSRQRGALNLQRASSLPGAGAGDATIYKHRAYRTGHRRHHAHGQPALSQIGPLVAGDLLLASFVQAHGRRAIQQLEPVDVACQQARADSDQGLRAGPLIGGPPRGRVPSPEYDLLRAAPSYRTRARVSTRRLTQARMGCVRRLEAARECVGTFTGTP